MIPAGNKAKRLSSVSHTTKTNHHHHHHPAHFSFAPGLGWEACLKKTEVNLESSTDINMLLMFEAGICQAIYRCAKANNEYMNNYDKRKTINDK